MPASKAGRSRSCASAKRHVDQPHGKVMKKSGSLPVQSAGLSQYRSSAGSGEDGKCGDRPPVVREAGSWPTLFSRRAGVPENKPRPSTFRCWAGLHDDVQASEHGLRVPVLPAPGRGRRRLPALGEELGPGAGRGRASPGVWMGKALPAIGLTAGSKFPSTCRCWSGLQVSVGKECARIRSEKGIRWSGRPLTTAA